jgi:hypothetical protein
MSAATLTTQRSFCMKKKLCVIIGIFLVLGLVFTACSDNNSSDDLFNGTWAESTGRFTISATNGSFKLLDRSVEYIRGIYTLSGNTANVKITEVNSIVFGGTVLGGTGWVKYSDLSSTQKAQLEAQQGIPENFVLTIVNNTFTYNGRTYTKSGNTNPDAPVITKFVVGITLADSDAGKPEKTVFNKGDQFLYGFQASDSKGDWKRMVHTVKVAGQSYDHSVDFPDRYIGYKNIGTNIGPLNLSDSGAYEMTWYILDQAGNKSNVITRTITVN